MTTNMRFTRRLSLEISLIISGISCLLLRTVGESVNQQIRIFYELEKTLLPTALEEELKGSLSVVADPLDVTEFVAKLTENGKEALNISMKSKIWIKKGFTALKENFKKQREAQYKQFNDRQKVHVYTDGPILSPHRLAFYTNLCGIDLTGLHSIANYRGLLVDCPTTHNRRFSIRLLSRRAVFENRKFRNFVLQNSMFKTWALYMAAPVSMIAGSAWAKMFDGSARVRAFLKRSVYTGQIRSVKADVLTLFSVGTEHDEVVAIGYGKWDYAQPLIAEKEEDAEVADALTLPPLVENKDSVYKLMWKNEVTVEAYTAQLDLETKLTPDASLCELAEVLNLVTKTFFSGSKPARKQNNFKIWQSQSASVRNIQTGIFGVFALCIGLLAPSTLQFLV